VGIDAQNALGIQLIIVLYVPKILSEIYQISVNVKRVIMRFLQICKVFARFVNFLARLAPIRH
jgi:hypothetical protein